MRAQVLGVPECPCAGPIEFRYEVEKYSRSRVGVAQRRMPAVNFFVKMVGQSLKRMILPRREGAH